MVRRANRTGNARRSAARSLLRTLPSPVACPVPAAKPGPSGHAAYTKFLTDPSPAIRPHDPEAETRHHRLAKQLAHNQHRSIGRGVGL
jgi:hypothetical protein